MSKRRMPLLMWAATLIQLLLLTRSGWAVTVPLWDSGPAIAMPGVPAASFVQPAGTVVMGRMAGSSLLSFVSSDGTTWLRNGGDQFGITTGSVDSDPAATYVANGQGIVWCAHRAGNGTAMICGKGNLQTGTSTPKIDNTVAPGPVGAGTFDAGSSPAVVAIGTDVYLFARGQNLQLWFTKLDASAQGHLANNGWSQLPAPQGSYFGGSPAAVKTSAGGGILEVCAQNIVGPYLCAVYSPASGFSSWNPAGIEESSQKPALAKSSSATYLFAIADFSPNDVVYSYSINGLTTWSSDAHVPYGTNFLNGDNIGPAVVANPTGTTVVVVGRAGDSAFYITYSGFSSGWSQINLTP
jgi:hypothetical protein